MAINIGGHTPGPWSVGRAMRNDQECIVGDGDSVVAFMPDETIGCTFIPANARLIAAAPELLDTLVKCRRALATVWGEDEKRLHEIDAAITKATGAKP